MTQSGVERLLQDPRQRRDVSVFELFFDLTIIFALTQFTQRFLRDFGWENSLQTAVLLAALWWVWVGMTRTTNWLDPGEPYTQRIIIGTMFAGLLLAASVPGAFGPHGIIFAGAYVAAHLVRHLLIVWKLRGHPLGTRSVRAATWFGTTAVLWITGAFLPVAPRLALWSAALILDYVGVGLGWRVPGLPPVPEAHLRVRGGHIAERHRQIFAIAVGELVLTGGVTYSRTGLDIVRMSAFALAFAIAGLIAWSFLLSHGPSLGETIDQLPSSASLRVSYAHLIMIIGIVITAMGTEILIARPLGETRAPWSAALLAGPFLYLAGRGFYAWSVFHQRAWLGPASLLVIAASSPALIRLPPLPVAGTVSLILLAVVLIYRRIDPAPTRTGTLVERLLRKREKPREILPYELFFDLTMIFSLTRVSQRILTDLSAINIAQSLILLAAIWWIWVATAWSTDWFNPDEPLLQRLLVGIMFAGLLMASAVPTAFGDHGLLFAGAYAAIHIMRGIVIVSALRGSPLQIRSARVLVWFSISAVFWLVGAMLPASDRVVLWAAALLVDGASAWFGWPVPTLNRTPQTQLKVTGEHIAERYRQVYLIAVGALILLSAQAYSAAGFDHLRTLAFALAFTTATMVLWSYLLPPGRDLARVVNTTAPRSAVAAAYCHGVMVAGTVLAAAGAELYIRRPLGHADAGLSLIILGGLAVHILGRTLLSVLAYGARHAWSGTVALLVIAGITPGLLMAPPLVVAGVALFVGLCLTISYRKATADVQHMRT